MGRTNCNYAVVDVETTGFSPRHHHRVIEIAIIRLDRSGKITGEFETLVNPNRDVGPVHIHGIRPRDLISAPTFAEIAGEVVEYLRGAVFVAHQVDFDWRFVDAEFLRLGYKLPPLPQICTMDVASEILPSISGRSLPVVCNRLGINYGNQHQARSDAIASAEILRRFLDKASDAELMNLVAASSPSISLNNKVNWPAVVPTGQRCPRNSVSSQQERAHSPIRKIVDNLPSYKDLTSNANRYLMALDLALSDFVLSDDETDELQDIAVGLGLVREQVVSVHHRYLRDFVDCALADGSLNECELDELKTISRLLAIDQSELFRILSEHGYKMPEARVKTPIGPSSAAELAGKAVCFTGTFTCTLSNGQEGRDYAEALSKERGMIVKPNVSKAVSFLIAADVHSMSGKAKKAREYGIPILSEEEFWRMMGCKVET